MELDIQFTNVAAATKFPESIWTPPDRHMTLTHSVRLRYDATFQSNGTTTFRRNVVVPLLSGRGFQEERIPSDVTS